MNRRRLLAACSSGLIGLAGCGSDVDHAEPGDDIPESTGTEPTEPGSTESSTDPPEVEPTWTVDDLSGAVSLALPDDARTAEPGSVSIHAATASGELLQVNPLDGSVDWRQSTRVDLDGDDESGRRLFSFRRLGDSLFTVAGNPAADEPFTIVTCRDAATGEERWHDRRREILTALRLRDGRLHVAGQYLRKPTDEIGPNEPISRSGRLRALDVNSGAVESAANIPASFSVVTASHGLYVQRQRPEDDWRYSVVAFDRDLTRRWQVDTDSQIGRSLETTEHGVLYTLDGALAELSSRTGKARWTVGGWTDSPRSPDALASGAIYAGVNPVKRLSPGGEVLYSLPTSVGGDVVASPSTGRVYVDDNENIYRVDRTSGTARWNYETPAQGYTDIASLPGDAVVVARGISGVTVLDVLDGATGNRRGEVRLKRGVSEATAVGELLTVAGHGRVGGYDVSTRL
jgi:outer membrane protein assembly factor BamB